jgi:endoglucanase
MRIAGLAVAAALAGPFYVDPDSNAERQARAWEQEGRTADAQLMRRLGEVPQAFWFTTRRPRRAVDRVVDAARKADKVPILVAYRACGARRYRRWIDGFARGIGPRRAIVIVEPDALASGCGARHVRTAVKRLERLRRATFYVDAGHSRWVPAKTMSKRLRRVGAHRFAINVSNLRTTEELIEYGERISKTAHFVIDTSRNGQGPNGTEWCNPPGRGVGAPPTTATGHPRVDAFLWIKPPGESDGSCNDGPPAGRWWPEYALGLAQRANPGL